MHAGKQKQRTSQWAPRSSGPDLQKLFCLWSQGLGLKCPLSPPTAPPLYMERTPSGMDFIYWHYKHSSPPKRIRHWWLPLLDLSSLFSFCEGTVGTHAHPWRCVHTTTLITLTWGPFYGSRQKLGSKLTVEKKSYKRSPTKNTSTFPHDQREGALFWKSILFGIFLKQQPWFHSHFGYLFLKDLYANTEHSKNAVLYW